MINAIGNIIGGGSARISYAKQLAKAYEARVIADGGVVESLGCFTAFATALGAYQPPIALAATGIGETSFTANWKSFSGAKYYLLDVSTSSTFNTFVYENQKINAPATSYVVIGLNSGTTYYYRVRASTDAFDADYQAVLDYATTQGYTLPSAGQQTLQNQLVVDLKAGGIWSKLDTFGVFATDGDSDFALIDWKRLSDYTAFNSPTFTTNQGFTGNGTSSYIDTNFQPINGTNYAQNSAHFMVYCYANDSASTYYGGALDTTPSVIRSLNFGGRDGSNRFSTVAINSTSSDVTATNSVLDDTGFNLITRTNSTTVKAYKDNTLISTFTNSSSLTSYQLARNIFLLARNLNGAANSFATRKLSIIGIGNDVDLLSNNYYTIVDNYYNAL
jgi:hypothetical protein